ncbi:MAG TPA: DUF4145 domain-containing protein [Candidatus Nanoarchaeia archaeon]|nr:DUF4145 domain-containing protein [Candidatus Nanoarchaeia archaeon]
MLLECNYCEAAVDAKVLNSYDCFDEEMVIPIRYIFLQCPRCSSPFLAYQEDYGNGWDEPTRLFPPRDKEVNPSLPESIRNAYKEARSCFKGKNYTAAIIMCRKTLEGVCCVHGIKARNLSLGLKEMKSKGIIENRLFEWAEALRIYGNEAAHDVQVIISAQDAKDIVAFTDALLEYVFTFRDKFNEFIERRKKLAGNKEKRDD